MKQPSKIQLQAIKHLSGPAQVIAGPGSGKTFVIIHRILHLIQHHHISPNEILVITFTKAAALEMKQRYEAAISEKQTATGDHVNFGTFHSICYHILQQSGGFRPDSLISEMDKRKMLQIIMANHGHAEKCNREVIADVLSEISRRKNLTENIDCDSQAEKANKAAGNILKRKQTTVFTQEELELFQKEYREQLAEQKKLDFDDMIGECLKLLTDYPDILKTYQKQFRYILVDEFQDINYSQYQVIKLLAGKEANLFIVGDDDQSIYGFRGAHPGIMQMFADDYRLCKQIMLTENYRSGEKIVRLAEKVIARNTERIQKNFIAIRPKGKIGYLRTETRKVEEEILTNEVSGLSDAEKESSAVILRTNREVIRYKEILKAAGIRVKELKHADNDIFHGFILDDIIAYLGFLYEGRKRKDFIQFMNKPEHYFTRLAIMGEVVCAEDMKRYYSQNEEMKQKVDSFFRQLTTASSLSPYMAVSFFRKSIGYENYLKKKASGPQEFQRYIDQLQQIQELIKDCKGRIKAEEFFRQKEEEQGKHVKSKEITQGISVITMHGAKGLEFEHVFLPDINEGVIPEKNCVTKEELEEERRLLYVAITRAKNHLHLYCTRERNRNPSSFLQGIILPQ